MSDEWQSRDTRWVERGAVVSIENARSATADFEALVVAHLPDAYRLATLLLGNAADAQDVTHDAALVAWRRWRTLRDISRFDAWFDRILVNLCRDRLRRRRRIRFVPMPDAEPLGSRPAPDAAVADRDLVARAAAGLTFEQRAAVVLRYGADLTIDEIADRLGIPAGTVKSRLHHAIAALRSALETADAATGRKARGGTSR
jgi:RNA polymerase sigma-70 factor (ECF subfamily)